MNPNSLYICYFGIREPLVQTQVLPYLREIRKAGVKMSILTFEPVKESADFAKIKQRLQEEGIEWHWLPYHKRFSVLATAWDIVRGAFFIRSFIKSRSPHILHCRVHVPALMGALGRKLARHKPKLIFDIRGFFPEEYTDAGIWPKGGWLYRSAKRVERWLLKEADGFVVLTEKARNILFPESSSSGFDRFERPVEVIPCCVDLSRFSSATTASRQELRSRYGLSGKLVVAYVGAFGGWYLTDETVDFFGSVKVRNPNTFALILTQSEPSTVEAKLRSRGYGDGDYLITKVSPTELPEYLSAADVAVSFIKRCYSKQASSPTKNAEYLACGVPIVANRGVGDVDELIDANHIGVIVDELSADGYRVALDALNQLVDVSDRCRQTARREFDLENVGGVRYRRLYERILGR
jgi:glycosyltransferase involved in cell wall biosynthesis